MPHYYVRQPDGRFAIFSSIVDDYIEKNLTREKLIEYVLFAQHLDTVREILQVCDYLEGRITETPRRNIMTYSEAEETRKIHSNSAKGEKE